MSETINKSDRQIGNQFNDINKKFDEMDKQRDEKEQETIEKIKMPHEKTIQDNLVNIREIFYVLFDFIFKFKNPIPFIFESPDRYFGTSIIFIIIGLLFIILSVLII